jgi:hypothetical protein
MRSLINKEIRSHACSDLQESQTSIQRNSTANHLLSAWLRHCDAFMHTRMTSLIYET